MVLSFSVISGGADLPSWFGRLGGLALLLLAVADGLPLPRIGGAVDLLVAVLAARRQAWWGDYAALAAAGTVIGGYTSYWLGRAVGARALEARLGPARTLSLRERLARRGWAAIAIGAMLPPPFPFTTLVVTAGVVRFPRFRFLSALAAGRCLRFGMVAFVGYAVGTSILRTYFAHQPTGKQLLAAAGVVVAVAGAAWLAFAIRKRRGRK